MLLLLWRISSGVLLLMFLLGCSHHDEVAMNFVNALEKASKSIEVNQELRIASINKSDWNKMFIFSPYTPLTEIETALKTQLSSEIKSIKIDERDDINLFIFLKNENVQMAAAVPRNVMDISIPKGAQPLNQERAVFKRLEGNTFVFKN